MPARKYYLQQLSEADRAKMAALFGRLADAGRISNNEKFKKVHSEIWEFKSFQLRFLGAFRPGKRFIVAHATRKKKDKLDAEDVGAAERILREHDQGERGT